MVLVITASQLSTLSECLPMVLECYVCTFILGASTLLWVGIRFWQEIYCCMPFLVGLLGYGGVRTYGRLLQALGKVDFPHCTSQFAPKHFRGLKGLIINEKQYTVMYTNLPSGITNISSKQTPLVTVHKNVLSRLPNKGISTVYAVQSPITRITANRKAFTYKSPGMFTAFNMIP